MTEQDPGKPFEQVPLEELIEQYLSRERFASSRVTSSRSRTPEQLAQAVHEVDESKREAKALFVQMVGTAANEFLTLPTNQRTNYLQDLRNSLRLGWSQTYSLSQTDLDNFSDQLTIKIVEILTEPPA